MNNRCGFSVLKSFVHVLCVVLIVQLRKRRRQLYHAKKHTFKKKNVKSRNRRPREYKTKDLGVYEKELKPTRTMTTIEKKLQVVRYWNKLKKEKEDARVALSEPRPVNMNKKQLKEWREARQIHRKTLKNNLQSMCAQKFPGAIFQSKICRWAKTAEREKWEEMPEVMRSRLICTSNTWRSKFGIAPKGRPLGGKVPLCLKKELDLLIGEMAVGRSRVSERKEVVTLECVASCRHPKSEPPTDMFHVNKKGLVYHSPFYGKMPTQHQPL